MSAANKDSDSIPSVDVFIDNREGPSLDVTIITLKYW